MSGWKNLCKRAVAGFCACGCMGMVLPAGVSAEGGTTMDQSDAVWSRQQEVLSGYASEWTKPTYEGLITDRVPHTALLGNGDVGVASGGDEVSKNFYKRRLPHRRCRWRRAKRSPPAASTLNFRLRGR